MEVIVGCRWAVLGLLRQEILLIFREAAVKMGQIESYLKCFEFTRLSDWLNVGVDEGEVIIKDDSHFWNKQLSKL